MEINMMAVVVSGSKFAMEKPFLGHIFKDIPGCVSYCAAMNIIALPVLARVP
jgi:hypothetical protein